MAVLIEINEDFKSEISLFLPYLDKKLSELFKMEEANQSTKETQFDYLFLSVLY